LEQDLKLAGDGGGFTIIEALGAVTPLEEEALTAGSRRELNLKVLDFPTGNEWR
jgi:hypothetical protein